MGVFISFIVVACIVVIPISVALVRNRRYAQATAYAHMQGWVPGNPELGWTHEFIEAAPSAYRTAGPVVIRDETTGFGKRAWIVAGVPPAPAEAPATPQLHQLSSRAEVPTASPASISTPKASASCAPRVLVLGRPQVIGWKEEPSRRIIPELACFLALHLDRSVPGEEIRAALWPGDLETTEASMKSLHNAISNLRVALGKEYVPVTSKGSGYRLAPEIRTDWDQFQNLIEKASRNPTDEIELLTSALELVRGAPFEGVSPGSYSWAWTELIVARIEVAVTKAAVRLSSLMLGANGLARARWAVFQGLSAAPYDRELWRIFLKAAAEEGPGELEKAVKHARSVLGEDVGELEGLIATLRA